MKTREALEAASTHLQGLRGHVFDVLALSKPVSADAALNLAKVVSKLSPLVGNMIEFNSVEILNSKREFQRHGRWVRQDPGFPDAIFQGKIKPVPGFEIKAWFPLATEITARFKDSQNHFAKDNTYVAMLAWLPEHLIYGRPIIIDVCVASGKSVAKSRDDHYHNPPDYLVLEPEDTSTRTRNLQQTNTNGYKWQGTSRQFQDAVRLVKSWGEDGKIYRPTSHYQMMLRKLFAKYPYRLDTNYAKMDRIVHREVEAFKEKVNGTTVNGMTVKQWLRLLSSDDDALIKKTLREKLNVTDQAAKRLVR